MISGSPGSRPIRIGVIGSATSSERGAETARSVGRALALAEAVLVCGGGTGVMAAAAAGAAMAQTTGAFLLGPSDEIEISVWLEPNLSSQVTVRPDGMISLPLIGSVEVAAGATDLLVVRDR